MHSLIFLPVPCGVLITATGRWSFSTITSTPACTLASTTWMSRVSSASVMRTVIPSSIIPVISPRCPSASSAAPQPLCRYRAATVKGAVPPRHCPGDCRRISSATSATARISSTSCTRTRCPPPRIAAVAAAAVANSVSRSVGCVRNDLREGPVRMGRSRLASSCNRARIAEFCSLRLPKPSPGSTTIRVRSKYYASDDRIEIHGTEGIIWINRCTGSLLDEPALVLYRDGETRAWHDIPNDWSESFRLGVHDFIDALIEGRQPPQDADDAAATLGFAIAAHVSACEHREVCLDEIGPDTRAR